MKNILIVGATSGIAIACTREWAARNARFFLIGRDCEKLRQVAGDLGARGATSVETAILDMNAFHAHDAVLDSCFDTLGAVDVCLVAHGTLPDQKKCKSDVDYALREFSSNGLSVVAFLTILANRMEAQAPNNCGHIFGRRRSWPADQLSVRRCEGCRIQLL
jgi:short-subunit dehydrogenase